MNCKKLVIDDEGRSISPFVTINQLPITDETTLLSELKLEQVDVYAKNGAVFEFQFEGRVFHVHVPVDR